MTPEALAVIHAAAFTRLRPWSAAEFAGLLSGAGVFLVTPEKAGASPPPRGEGMGVGAHGHGRQYPEGHAPDALRHDLRPPLPHPSPTEGGGRHTGSDGFLLGRALAGEAEVLTLAVRPEAQGRGLGGELMAAFLAEASARGSGLAFLEVAADNAVARRLYARAGFAETGLRRGYFIRIGGGVVDGVVMARDLPGS